MNHTNESQLTLVDTTPSPLPRCPQTPSAGMRLDFSRTDADNVAAYVYQPPFTTSNSCPLYSMQCNENVTIVRRRDTVVGVLECRSGLVPSREISLWLGADEDVEQDIDDSDACTIVHSSSSRDEFSFEKFSSRPGGYRTKLGKWLRTPRFSRYPVTFVAEGKTFEWHESATGLLVAHESGRLGDAPIACFQQPRAAGNEHAESATLTLPDTDNTGLAVRDAIFISLVAIAQRQGSSCSSFITRVFPEVSRQMAEVTTSLSHMRDRR